MKNLKLGGFCSFVLDLCPRRKGQTEKCTECNHQLNCRKGLAILCLLLLDKRVQEAISQIKKAESLSDVQEVFNQFLSPKNG